MYDMKWKTVIVRAENGDVLYKGAFNELPVKEDYVIEKSVELYQEEEPCIIYRTHIVKKLYLDILEQFGGKPEKGRQVDCRSFQEVLAPLALDTSHAVMEFR